MPKQLTIVGGSVNTSMVTATAGDVLMGKDFVDSTGAIINGTIFAHDMAYLNEQYADEENGVQSTTESGTSFTIQQGYYGSNLSIPIKPLDLSTATVGNVEAGDIRNGKIGWVNGEQVVGTMVEKLGTRSLSLGGTTSILAGQTGTWNFSCYVEKIKVTTAPLSEQTVGTATADDIIIGKTAWVNGEEVTGSLDITLDEAQLTASTQGDVLPGDIIKGKIAWVNGQRVVGTMKEYNSLGVDITTEGNGGKILAGTTRKWTVNGFVYRIIAEGAPLSEQTAGTATADDIRSGKIAWVNGEEITGTAANISESYDIEDPDISFSVTETGGYSPNTTSLANPIKALFIGEVSVVNNSTNITYTSDKFSIYLDSTKEPPDPDYNEHMAISMVVMDIGSTDLLVLKMMIGHDVEQGLLWCRLGDPMNFDGRGDFDGITGYTTNIKVKKIVDFTGGV